MSQPKRILMILENSGYPEDTRVLMEANSLTDAGYQVSLICPTGKRKSRYELVGQVHVYRYPAPFEFSGFWGYLWEYGYSLFCAFWLSLWVWFWRGFDAIHIHCPPDLNGLLGVFYRMAGKKFVMDLHDLSPELYQAQKENRGSRTVERALRLFERISCRNASLLIATNQTQQRIQIDRCGADPGRCFVVRNGPNELFTNPVEVRQDLKIAGKTVVGYVGTMGIQDGVDYLIRAMEVIKRSRDDIHAIIVGEGSAVGILKNLVRELDLDSCVTFTGYVEFKQVPQCIAAFDICATPDPSNPYNDSCTTIKTMEYMAVGKPIVAFRTPENELSAADSALYADTIEDFARQICRLADDPALRAEMGQKGRQRIMSSLTWGHQRAVLLQAYAQLFGSRSAEPEVANPLAAGTSNGLGPAIAIAANLNQPVNVDSGLQCQFPFSGRLGNFLQQALDRDIQSAVLSPIFRNYYRVRRFIPTSVRTRLQRSRNQHCNVDTRWYIPQDLERKLQSLDQPFESIWPDRAQYAFVLTHDVEDLVGFKRILRIATAEEQLGFRSCWNLVPYKYPIDMAVVEELRDRGHEIAIHGYNHDGRLFWDKRTFDWRSPKINAAVARYGATGFRAPMVHRNLRWMQDLEVEYDSSCFDVDPFQAIPGGVQNIWPFRCGRFVELPYTLPQDHTLFVTLKENSTRVWDEKLKFIRQFHGMALMLTHPDYMITSKVLDLYLQFLTRVRDAGESWPVLPGELARWFVSEIIDKKPPELPCELARLK
jgi:glycosyltransferase involved in cell wall biosynthesis